ncbi:hypothetical protein [Clostridium sp. UBA4548]|uniref:hypothetical protein n=1 Tax=Clostridium sp. UBA4548 TaxID=1946361 RepID=UPI0025BF2B25|nr:hypothetical protein [Clostridium sp. UBA4548]
MNDFIHKEPDALLQFKSLKSRVANVGKVTICNLLKKETPITKEDDVTEVS